MYTKPYSIEEVYQLIKEKYPQYNDDTIIFKKWGKRQAITFKETLILILSEKSLNVSNLTKNNVFLKFFPELHKSKLYWKTKFIHLIQIAYCPNCKHFYSFNNFSKNSTRLSGLESLCKQCGKEKAKQYYQEHKKERKEYRQAHMYKIKKYMKQYRQEHKKEAKKYQQEHKEECAAKTAKRRAAKLQRTPKWAELKQIEQFYIKRPKGYHVDHIIPLQGDKVSGFHCLANLQYLPTEENLSKSNKYIPRIEVKGIDY